MAISLGSATDIAVWWEKGDNFDRFFFNYSDVRFNPKWARMETNGINLRFLRSAFSTKCTKNLILKSQIYPMRFQSGLFCAKSVLTVELPSNKFLFVYSLVDGWERIKLFVFVCIVLAQFGYL